MSYETKETFSKLLKTNHYTKKKRRVSNATKIPKRVKKNTKKNKKGR